jgi:hypothetical protein
MNAGELADGAAFDARLGAVDAENSVLLGALPVAGGLVAAASLTGRLQHVARRAL